MFKVCLTVITIPEKNATKLEPVFAHNDYVLWVPRIPCIGETISYEMKRFVITSVTLMGYSAMNNAKCPDLSESDCVAILQATYEKKIEKDFPGMPEI